MNHYSNENSYIPSEFSQSNMSEYNNMEIDSDIRIAQMNPKSNFNFNICNYNQNIKPNELYDVYNGYIRGNMFPDLYNEYKINRPYEIEPLNEQGQLLTYIDAYSFAAHDLNLYLDTHPNDKQMIELFHKFAIESDAAEEEYAKKFRPLVVDQSNTFPWAWNKEPWPWENR